MPRKLQYPYVQSFIDKRTGKTFYYYRREGFERVRLPAPYGGESFRHAYDLAQRGKVEEETAPHRSPPGSMSALIASYYRSPRFLALAPTTAAVYRRILEAFRNEHGHKTVALMQARHVEQVLAEKAAPHARRRLLKILNLLMRHAIKSGLRSDNPCTYVDAPLPKSDGHTSWSEAEINLYRQRWLSGSRERLMFELAICTGQRKSDVARIGWRDVKAGAIELRQSKTGAAVRVPIMGDLQAEIATLPRDLGPFLKTASGVGFTANGLGNAFHDAVAACGFDRKLSIHGLRKAAGRRLAEAGCTAPEIMSILGHKTLAEAQRYIDAFNRMKAGQVAIEKVAQMFEIGKEK